MLIKSSKYNKFYIKFLKNSIIYHSLHFLFIKLFLVMGYNIKIQEFMENRKTRRKIQFLPDIALQKTGMVGHVVQNFRRRQAEPTKSIREVAGRHSDPCYGP